MIRPKNKKTQKQKKQTFQWKQQQKQQQQKSQKPKFFEKNNKKYEKLIQKPTSASREPPQQVFHKEKQPLSPGRPQVNIYFLLSSYVEGDAQNLRLG